MLSMILLSQINKMDSSCIYLNLRIIIVRKRQNCNYIVILVQIS